MTKETLLVVEDNHILRKGLSEMLTLAGYKILTAANGREALEQITKVTPDLILADISMPEMDGFTLFKEVRRQIDWITIPFIFLTARSDEDDILEGKNLGAEDYLVKPVTHQELITSVKARLNRSRQIRMVQLQQAYEASLTALANAIDLRDRYTRGHVERVTAYSLLLARALKIPEYRLDHLRFGAILHDVGKIHVQEKILLKSDELDDLEWKLIRQHPVNGAEMIKDIPFLAPAVPIVRSHHERWDGKGYPDGLAGDQIPLGARIVAVADAFDALTSKRPYHETQTLELAYQEIISCSGKQFDPKVIAAFEEAWHNGELQEIATEIQDEISSE